MELKAQDLRIGNLVTQNGFYGYVYSIESAMPRSEKRFSDKEIITLFDNGITTVPIDEITPIPITEDILLNKCKATYQASGSGGQDEWAGVGHWTICGLHFNGTKKGTELYYGRDWDSKIEFVHQLQNIIKELKKKELIIEL